jgi:hypothetical protein
MLKLRPSDCSDSQWEVLQLLADSNGDIETTAAAAKLSIAAVRSISLHWRDFWQCGWYVHVNECGGIWGLACGPLTRAAANKEADEIRARGRLVAVTPNWEKRGL